jgi:hypothetical protein
MILVTGTCGDNGSTRVGSIVSPSGAGHTDYTFDTYTTGAGNSYKLCYSEAPTDETDVTEYDVEVDGEAELIGANALEAVCMKGESCTLTVSGYGFAAGNKARLLASGACTDAGTLADWGTSFTADPVASSVTSAQEEFAFGAVESGTPGATYKLCWGAASVTSENIELDGNAELHGPATADINACTLGLSCTVDITGAGLEDDNDVVVISGGNCGSGTALLSSPTKVSSAATALQRTFAAINSATTVGDSYKLCWGKNPTADVSTYPVTVDGTFEVAGPDSSSTLACTFGFACSLTLGGYGLTTDNHVVLISSGTCAGGDGVAETLTWSPGSLLTEPDSGTATSTQLKFNFGTPTAGTPQLYRICWGFNHSALNEHTVEVGDEAASIIGPTDLSVTLACTLGIACSQDIAGVGLAATSKVLIVDGSCGSGTPVNTALTHSGTDTSATYAATIVSGAPGTSLKLCWGINPPGTAASDYPLEVGSVTLNGPVYGGFDCTLTKACTFTLTGGEGLAATNRVVIVNGACGDSGAVAVPFATSVEASVAGSPYTTYAFSGFQVTGTNYLDPLDSSASYSICWGHAPASDTDIVGHNVEVSASSGLKGPYGMEAACVIDTACSLTMSGVGLASTNRMYVVTGTGTCGKTLQDKCGKSGAPIMGANNECWLVAPDDNGDGTITFNMGTPSAASGSNYNLCWGDFDQSDIDSCTGVCQTIRSGSRVRIDEDFRICGNTVSIDQCIDASS